MRILMVSNNYKPLVGGVITSVSLFRQGLLDARQDVHLIAPEYSDYEDLEPYIFRMPALDLSDQLEVSVPFPFKTRMMTIVGGIKPALIHSQHPFVLGSLAADCARDLNIPLVYTYHTRYDEYAQQYVSIAPNLAGTITDEIVGRYLEKCTHVIAPTPSIRDLVLRDYDVQVPVSVVPNPVDLNRYENLDPRRVRTALGMEGAEMLLYVGRLAEEKNLIFLLRAFSRIVTKHPHARLLLVGSGVHEQRLRRTASKLGIAEYVEFVGSIPHEEIPHYTAAADVFVFTSLTDTQGMVLIEAMAAGTPVVALRAPGPADILAEGGGLLVDGQEEAFSEAVLGLLTDEVRRRSLGGEAVQAVQRYTVPIATECLLEVYESAIETGPRRGMKHANESGREFVDPLRSLWEHLSEVLKADDEGTS